MRVAPLGCCGTTKCNRLIAAPKAIAAHHEVHPNVVTVFEEQVLEILTVNDGDELLAEDGKERIWEVHEKLGELIVEGNFSQMHSGSFRPERQATIDRDGPDEER